MTAPDDAPKQVASPTEPQVKIAIVDKPKPINSPIVSNSPWFQGSPHNETPVVHPKTVTPLPRSISAFNIQEIRDQISPAAPFPSLPTKQEVQNVKMEIEAEINRLKADLTSYEIEKKSLELQKTAGLNPPTTKDGVHIFRGMVITENQISDIIKANKEKCIKSRKRTLLDPCDDDNLSAIHKLPKYRHLVDLPQFKKTIDVHSDLLTPLYAAKFAEKDVLMEKEDELAETYNELDEQWQQREKVIDEYNDRTSEKSENWPTEFKFDRPVLDDAARLKWAAQDTPMILSKEQQIDRCYYDTNSFVGDPVSEFKDYKRRLVWTEEEKKIFVEKYTLHPKSFAQIAESFPDKTIKDVIEFYYLNRYRMNLKENEGAARKRGGKKKVVTEGSKKNY